MNLLLRILLYVCSGALLVAGNFWYLRSLFDEFSKKSPSIIAPFQIIGKEDKDGSLGMSLSHMLIGRIGKIQQEMEASAHALEIARGSISSTNVRPQDRRNIPLSIPTQIFEPLDIELTFRGIEVGGIISWLHNALTTENILKLSVHYSDNSATLIGTTGQDGDSTIYLENLNLRNEQIVSAAAYTIAQKEFAKRFPEVGTLDRNDFGTLLDSLHQAAQLKKQVALGRTAEDDYNQLLSKMEDLANEIPRWKPLLRLVAEMAENASQKAKALQYYRMELDETDNSSNSFASLLSKIETLENELALEIGVATSIPKEQFEPNVILEKLRTSDAGKKVLEQVNVSSFEMPNQPKIAVLGGLPYENIVPNERKTILPSLTKAEEQDPFMTEYISTVVETVRLVAPDSNFIFQSISSHGGGMTASEIIKSIGDLIDASPNIILITLGPLDSNIYEKLFAKAIEKNILLVVTAGNEGSNRKVALDGKEVLQKMMVVSATDQSGNQASFTQKNDLAFWAPGVNIPVYMQQGERVNFTTRDGTSYSAAIAAGIAARLLAQKPELSITDLLAILRNTSRKIIEPDGPQILNLTAALQSKL